MTSLKDKTKTKTLLTYCSDYTTLYIQMISVVQNAIAAVACIYFRGFFNIVLAKNNMIAGVTSLHIASICVKVTIGEVEL